MSQNLVYAFEIVYFNLFSLDFIFCSLDERRLVNGSAAIKYSVALKVVDLITSSVPAMSVAYNFIKNNSNTRKIC